MNTPQEVNPGQVLVASPKLMDPNFFHAIIYMVHHDDEGSFGLVINHPSTSTLKELITVPDPLKDIRVYAGGPVQSDRIIFGYFQVGDTPNVLTCSLESNLEQLEALQKTGKGWIRAFVGYSGWGEGQLASELSEQAWSIKQPNTALFDSGLLSGLWSVYNSGDGRWRSLLPYLPDDPSLN